MKGVAFWSRPRAAIDAASDGSSFQVETSPRADDRDDRGTSVGKVKTAGAGELSRPVRQRMVQVRLLQAPALPGSVVDVADLRVGERGRMAAHQVMIQPIQFLQEDGDRPIIAGDVGESHEEDMVVVAAPDQRRPHQKAGFEVERQPEVRSRQATDLGILLDRCEMVQVDAHRIRWRRRVDDLHDSTVFEAESGAQSVVAPHDLAERPEQCIEVEVSLEATADRDVVGSRLRCEVGKEPEPLFREGDGIRLRFGRGIDPIVARARSSLRDPRGQIANGGVIEEFPGGIPDPSSCRTARTRSASPRASDRPGRGSDRPVRSPGPSGPRTRSPGRRSCRGVPAAGSASWGSRGNSIRALRSILPFGVVGSSPSKRIRPGTMYSGRIRPSCVRTS